MVSRHEAINLSRIKDAWEEAIQKAQESLKSLWEERFVSFLKTHFSELKFPAASTTKSESGFSGNLDLQAVNRSPTVPEAVTEDPEEFDDEDYFVFQNRKRWQLRDNNSFEKTLNIVTSLPLIGAGLAAPKTSQASQWFGKSVVAVGVCSAAYHSSSGDIRKKLRWGDYVAIALSSMLLSNALSEKTNLPLTVASVAVLPFKPFAAAAINTLAAEAALYNKAKANPALKKCHRAHLASAAAAGSLMIADDLFPENKYFHAAWHLVATVGILSAHQFLKE